MFYIGKSVDEKYFATKRQAISDNLITTYIQTRKISSPAAE